VARRLPRPRPRRPARAPPDLDLRRPRALDLRDVDGAPVDPTGTTVALWHPVGAGSDEVRAWRRALEAREIRQPFKQADREVYRLTDAERTTGSYSNRFAAHVLRQHQLAALARARGWSYSLQGTWDDPDHQAELQLPEHGLTAAFTVDRPGTAGEVNDTGVFTYVLTDHVRFRSLDGRTRPLDTIPARVFSEVMRDVDLFVGVTSRG
jgi:hypothetical protein